MLHPEVTKYFKKKGSNGGKARARNLTKEQLSEIGKLGVAARKAKRIKKRPLSIASKKAQ